MTLTGEDRTWDGNIAVPGPTVVRMSAFVRRGSARSNCEDTAVIGSTVLAGPTPAPLDADDIAGFIGFVDSPVVAGVFDGLGGHGHGQTASSQAAIAFAQRGSGIALDPSEFLAGAAHWLEALTRVDRRLEGMGCTAAIVAILSDQTLILNVGDTRVYGLHGRTLCKLSVDDVPPGAEPSGRITQCLGGDFPPSQLSPHVITVHRNLYQRLLICSDGVTGHLSEAHIEAALRATRPLVELWSCTAGVLDDATCVLVELPGWGPQTEHEPSTGVSKVPWWRRNIMRRSR